MVIHGHEKTNVAYSTAAANFPVSKNMLFNNNNSNNENNNNDENKNE